MNTGRICFTPLRVLIQWEYWLVNHLCTPLQNNYVHHYSLCKQFHGVVRHSFHGLPAPSRIFDERELSVEFIESKWRDLTISVSGDGDNGAWSNGAFFVIHLDRQLSYRQTIELDRQSNYRPQASQSLFRNTFRQLIWTHQRYTAGITFAQTAASFSCASQSITKHRHALRNQI
jgi:hypothetical protein